MPRIIKNAIVACFYASYFMVLYCDVYERQSRFVRRSRSKPTRAVRSCVPKEYIKIF
jgi:hypothetical protein